ncbi:hypothetical protein AB0F36_07805 [Streptomyces sp. NPDC029080]|uniref:hypothetical protein n=1 Tax=Streptomyces sp. NPDC029080 TaxID=3155017 RepID=UPI0033F3AE7E
MAKLPSDAELTKMFVLNQLTDQEIADKYDVTRQAVQSRWRKLGLERRPVVNQANSLIGNIWKIRSDHHTLSPIMYLRVWIRLNLGDKTLSTRQTRDAMNFERRVRTNRVVLAYDPESDQGWSWESRTPRDDLLVVRLPDSGERPSEDVLRHFRLPDLPTAE